MIPTLEVFGRLAGYVGKAGRHYAGLQAGLRFHGDYKSTLARRECKPPK